MNKKQKLLLAEHLRSLASGGHPLNTYWGICSEIRSSFGEAGERLVKKHFKSWTKFSGSEDYPVGGMEEFNRVDNLWIGKSGQLRRSLCRHIAKQLSKETK